MLERAPLRAPRKGPAQAARRAGVARTRLPPPTKQKAATELSLDRPTYEALARLNVSGADAATKHYVEKTLRDFKRAGVGKLDIRQE